jgi:hypothetical protein
MGHGPFLSLGCLVAPGLLFFIFYLSFSFLFSIENLEIQKYLDLNNFKTAKF